MTGAGTSYVPLRLALEDLRDTAAAVARMRALLDADADPVAVDAHLGADPALAPLVEARPGLRVPGHVAGSEIAVRAVLGQQVTVVAARTAAARLVAEHGRAVTTTIDGLTHLFPDAATVAAMEPTDFRMPRARGRALIGLAAALADGDLVLDRGPDRGEVRERLLALPGIGPWTADYIALRALGHPDIWLPTDVGVRHGLASLPAGGDADVDSLGALALLRPAPPVDLAVRVTGRMNQPCGPSSNRPSDRSGSWSRTARSPRSSSRRSATTTAALAGPARTTRRSSWRRPGSWGSTLPANAPSSTYPWRRPAPAGNTTCGTSW